jgi:hypothetical protein
VIDKIGVNKYERIEEKKDMKKDEKKGLETQE